MTRRIALLLCMACVCASIASAEETSGEEERPAQGDASIEGVDYRRLDYGYHHKFDKDRSLYDSLFPGPCPVCPTTPKWCTCQCTGQAAGLVFEAQLNGCTSDACSFGSPGPFCDETTASTTGLCTTCSPQIGQGVNSDVGYCRGNAVLCYKVTCPRNGVITISGESIPGPAAGTGCCGVGSSNDGLFLFAGAYSASATPLVADVNTLSYSAACQASDIFNVCERLGIIRVNTLSATFLDTSTLYKQGECPTGCTSTSVCTTVV